MIGLSRAMDAKEGEGDGPGAWDITGVGAIETGVVEGVTTVSAPIQPVRRLTKMSELMVAIKLRVFIVLFQSAQCNLDSLVLCHSLIRGTDDERVSWLGYLVCCFWHRLFLAFCLIVAGSGTLVTLADWAQASKLPRNLPRPITLVG